LSPDLQQIVANACIAENAFALAETEWHNAAALAHLVTQHGVKVRAFPPDVLDAVRTKAVDLLAEFSRFAGREGSAYPALT
jgi:TRAP-type mannitol/chloroaromatic compound transport system substrate-binding protein